MPERVHEALRTLGPTLASEGFYLAGGTALALQFDHRASIDLDFFRENQFDPAELRRTLDWRDPVLDEGRGTLTIAVGGVKLQCLEYPYPLLRPVVMHGGIPLAHPIDIGLMKITAIGSRGARKDFIDLFAIMERVLPLPELFKLLPQKYGQRANYLHLWKGLTFFADADLDPNYPGWKGAKWSNIKQFFRQEAYKIKLLVDQS